MLFLNLSCSRETLFKALQSVGRAQQLQSPGARVQGFVVLFLVFLSIGVLDSEKAGSA